jgi:hypothetical protein
MSQPSGTIGPKAPPRCQDGVTLIDFAGVAGWLPSRHDDVVAGIECWLYELEVEEGWATLEPEDLDELWDLVVDLAGGSLHVSLERELRLVLGEVAALADLAAGADEDAADEVSVEWRLRLQQQGRQPSGIWEAALLADKLLNADRAHNSWAALEPSAARAAFAAELSAIAEACAALAASTRSVAARRMLASTSAFCAYRRGDVDTAIALVEEFFNLERQSQRESSRTASIDELVSVAFVGVNAFAGRRDAAGIAEVMRRVRLLAEPAGGTMHPVFVEMWSTALCDLDPAFAQMLAHQMLADVQAETGLHSDESMSAAYALLLSTAAADGDDAAQTLFDVWFPIALGSGPGPGARVWVESVQVEEPGASADER